MVTNRVRIVAIELVVLDGDIRDTEGTVVFEAVPGETLVVPYLDEGTGRYEMRLSYPEHGKMCSVAFRDIRAPHEAAGANGDPC